MARKFIISIDLGGTNLKIAILDSRYRIRTKEILSTVNFRGKQGLISAIIVSINSCIAEHKLKNIDILGVGLGFPGPVDKENGIVHFLPNIAGWREVNIKKILETSLGLPVFLDNDAKLMGLAELKLGNARRFNNALCVTLGTGVGGALIIGGSLYRGADNAAGEIGHIPLNEQGPSCACGGIACLERYIGNSSIKAQAREIFNRKVSLEELAGLAKRKEKKALRVWFKVGSRLGRVLTGVVNLLNLDGIVIGGGVANAGDALFNGVKAAVKKHAMSVQSGRVKIIRAKFGNDAGLIGAAVLVVENAK